MRDQPRGIEKINAEKALRKCPQGKLRARSSLRKKREKANLHCGQQKAPARWDDRFWNLGGVEKRRRIKITQRRKGPSRTEKENDCCKDIFDRWRREFE